MIKYKIILLLAVLLFPLAAAAQENEPKDIDEYTEELNSVCPIYYKDGWAINSFTMVGENYALVDIQTPPSLSMVLPRFTTQEDNVKQMWLRQLKRNGDRWNRFVSMLAKSDRRLIINFRPEGSDDTALLTFYPSDLKKR